MVSGQTAAGKAVSRLSSGDVKDILAGKLSMKADALPAYYMVSLRLEYSPPSRYATFPHIKGKQRARLRLDKPVTDFRCWKDSCP